jgi:uncharacterized membrane protein
MNVTPNMAVPVGARPRIGSVDLLRGLVMIVMALDHVRDFFHQGACCADPANPATTTVALFFTRWVTHFCAPVFVLLAGTGAYLYGSSRNRTRGQLARFLVSRGLWLIAMELTVVRFALLFNLDYTQLFLQVIWAIGWSMLVLAALVFLPMRAIVALAVVTIAGHNLLDGIGPAPYQSIIRGPAALDAGAWIWSILHVPNPPIIYPLVPWVGVMALGYALGAVFRKDAAARRRTLLTIGAGLTAGFVVVRAINGYGDPSPWSPQRSPLFTAFSFLNTTKYPPSLSFLLMTLGPSLVLLALVDRARAPVVQFLTTYGRVPFFYYVLHFYLIHALALVAAMLTGFDVAQFRVLPFLFPPTYGFSLSVVYLIWIAVVLALYVPCRWFASLKARRTDPWMSYL